MEIALVGRAGGSPYWERMGSTLQAIWRDTVRRDPSATALVEAGSGRSWTRAELSEAADTWRTALPAESAAALPGQVVVFAEANGAGWWTTFVGLLAAGAIPAALDAGETPATQIATAKAIGATWTCRDGRLERVAPADGDVRRQTNSKRRRARDLCLLKITSGSTGLPRALPFTHGQMVADGKQICATMDVRPDDVNLAAIPLGHSYGLGNLVMPLIQQGTALVCAASPLPQVLAADCARWRPTVFPAVPALLRALAMSEVSAEALASLRVVISAGAPLPAEVAVAFAEKFGVRVHGFYGSSETGGIGYDRSGEATLSGRSVGTPLEGVALELRRGRRLLVTSAAVMRRGSFSPADRATLNEHGEIVLLGRTGRSLKIGGRRVDLGEIERALRALPGVSDAYAAPHPSRAEAVAAAVATARSAAEIRAELAQRLAPWKVPARIVALPMFPLTLRGKIDARALRLRLAAP